MELLLGLCSILLNHLRVFLMLLLLQHYRVDVPIFATTPSGAKYWSLKQV